MGARTLRWFAVFGVLTALAVAVGASFPLGARQGSGFVLLLVISVAVGVAILTLMPGAVRELVRHPDLMVPLGVYLLAGEALRRLGVLPLLSAPLLGGQPVALASLSLQLSLIVLLGMALAVARDTWATRLIVDTVSGAGCEPRAALAGIPRWFWRVAGLEAICWGVLLLLGGAILLTVGAGPSVVLPVALLLLAPVTLILNLATAALLPVALDDRLSFPAALRQGVRLSWRTKSRWWKPVLVQLILLGFITFVAVSFRESTGPNGSQDSSATAWNVSGIWTGGYNWECRWYDTLADALETEKVPLVSTVLGLVFGVLAVVVKLSVVRSLPPSPGGGGAGGEKADS